MSELETMHQEFETTLRVVELAPLGYGNPESKIRYEREDDPEIMELLKGAAVEIIRSGECLVSMTEIDDGCIDGRTAIGATYIDKGGETKTVTVEAGDEHERSKVAGGGYMTSLAMELAINPPMRDIETTLDGVVKTLAKENIFCGMHTGSHENTETGACDCGANDKFEQILENGIAFGDKIAASTQAIVETAGVEYSNTAQQQGTEGWARALSAPDFFKNSTGDSRSSVVSACVKDIQEVVGGEKPLSVSKKLGGDHNERFIVAVFVEGKTFSQKKLRERLMQRFPDVDESILPQAFVVDVPRVAELSGGLTKDADDDKQQTTLQAGTAYQFATAATLTDGSLRVFALTA